MTPEAELLAAASIVLFTFVSEDAAVIGAGVLAAAGKISWSTALLAGFLGVWAGDLGLYSLARCFGRKAVDRLLRDRARANARLERSQAWFHRHGWYALALCRMIPGTRLPTYLSAGLLRMPAWRFAAATGLLALLWVTALLVIVRQVGAAAPMLLDAQRGTALLIAGAVAAALVLWFAWRRTRWPVRWRWEFWPAWLLYLPVACWYLLLALRHRSLTLPTCANPGMFTGGMIGESKMATLSELERTSPDWIATGFLVEAGPVDGRLAALDAGLRSRNLTYPVVLKPDVGQRGSGFRIARTRAEAEEYLTTAQEAVIVQEYLPGPREAGVFYVRFPGQQRGRIFSITDKEFPVVVGDGVRTVEALVRADPRARVMAGLYLERLAARRRHVPAAGERVRLVEAGNHAQGCIFHDATSWITPALEARIDEISRRLEGFYIGRYDVRYARQDDLLRGEGFKILELNGAASEATNAYDASHPIRRSYAILFEQWRLVFAVAAANRARGHRPAPALVLWREWSADRRRSHPRPVAH